MSKVLTIAAHKGGVGKSTTTVLLAHYLAERGYKVAVIDNDPQGNASSVLSMCPDGSRIPFDQTITASLYSPDLEQVVPASCHGGIDLIPSPKNCDIFRRISSSDPDDALVFAENIQAFIEAYDVVLIDCPPNFSLNVIAAMIVSTHVLCPVKLSGHAIDGVEGIIKTVREVQARYNPSLVFLGAFINLLEKKGKLIKQNSEYLREAMGGNLLNTSLYNRTPIDTVNDEGGTLKDLGYAHAAIKEVNQLMAEIVERLNHG